MLRIPVSIYSQMEPMVQDTIKKPRDARGGRPGLSHSRSSHVSCLFNQFWRKSSRTARAERNDAPSRKIYERWAGAKNVFERDESGSPVSKTAKDHGRVAEHPADGAVELSLMGPCQPCRIAETDGNIH